MDKVRAKLNRMEEMGVIVKQTEPTQWVNSMVVVNKGQKIRICIDPERFEWCSVARTLFR